MTIRDLQKQCWQQAEDKGFHDDRPEGGPELTNWLGNKLMLIVSEAAEAQEELRSGYRADKTYYTAGGKPEGVPSELADIVIRTLDLAGTEGIDLQTIIEEKLRYNATRARLHGRTF